MRRQYLLYLIFGLLVLVLAGCQIIVPAPMETEPPLMEAAREGDESPGIVLRIGERAITAADFDQRFMRMVHDITERQGIPFNEETLSFFEDQRIRYLDQLAAEEALLVEAARRGIDVTDAELEPRIAQVRQRYESEEAYQQALVEAGFADEGEFRQFIRNNEILRRVTEELSWDIEITDEEIENFYQENQERFRTQAGIPPLEEVDGQILEQLWREELNLHFAELRKQAEVETFPEQMTPFEHIAAAQLQSTPEATAEAEQ